MAAVVTECDEQLVELGRARRDPQQLRTVGDAPQNDLTVSGSVLKRNSACPSMRTCTASELGVSKKLSVSPCSRGAGSGEMT